LEKTETAVRALLSDMQDLTGSWAQKAGIKLVLSCPEDIGTALLDERRIKQVFINLIRNAIASTPDGGTITLAAEKQKNLLTLSVSDTGRGIAAEDQERLFKPFEKITKTPGATPSSGAGLGLALVSNIVKMHNGSVRLESRETKGTTVSFTLPLSPAKKTTAGKGAPHGKKT
ncbi:MAG: ATP-binding protein, partial [Alphaproteobacteria bacterium]|nr:ATP-binding protein [Alphaproteobacteria bacterium]